MNNFEALLPARPWFWTPDDACSHATVQDATGEPITTLYCSGATANAIAALWAAAPVLLNAARAALAWLDDEEFAEDEAVMAILRAAIEQATGHMEPTP